MKIALINPPFLFDMVPNIGLSQCLGLRSLSALLKVSGDHEVIFVDALMLGFDQRREHLGGILVGLKPDEVVNQLPHDVDLVGVSAPFSQAAPFVHDLIAAVRFSRPEAAIIMGGPYPSSQPNLALRSLVDYIVVGEGETPLLAFVNGQPAADIQGFYNAADIDRQAFTPSERVLDLDSLPMKDYEIPLMENYFNISPRAFTGRRTAALVTSRGCPYDCHFCSIHPVVGYPYRFRSAAHVLDEIEYLVRAWGVDEIEIEDDNFSLIKSRTVEILEGIIRLNEQGAGLGWRTPNGIRLDTLDDEVITLMKRANCKEIVVALEHGDPEMQFLMNKRLDLDKAFHVIQSLIQHGLERVTLFVMLGYPGETEARFQNSLRFLEKVRDLGGNTFVSPNITQVYPGTALAQQCIEKNWIEKDYLNFLENEKMTGTGGTFALETPDFDKEILRRRREQILAILPHQAKY